MNDTLDEQVAAAVKKCPPDFIERLLRGDFDDWSEISLNDTVRVKLTDRGRQIHRNEHKELFSKLPVYRPYKPPKEDRDGYSQWQLWSLMSTFGSHCNLGSEPPFDINMQVKPSRPPLANSH